MWSGFISLRIGFSGGLLCGPSGSVKHGKFLTNQITIGFLRRTLLHEVSLLVSQSVSQSVMKTVVLKRCNIECIL